MESNWKEKLSPEQYKVMREKGTEPPFTGEYLNFHEKGVFLCSGCGQELFSSDTKFDSGTGWPSFTEPANSKNIELREDNSLGIERTEVVCKKCGSHLGHLFDDGLQEKGGKRYCINSVCLNFEKKRWSLSFLPLSLLYLPLDILRLRNKRKLQTHCSFQLSFKSNILYEIKPL